MPPDIDKLPYQTRQAILAQIRQQVGDALYEQLLSQLGEDGLLRMALSETSGDGSSQPATPTKKDSWRQWLIWGGVLAFCALSALLACSIEFEADAAKKPVWRAVGGFFIGFFVLFGLLWLYASVIEPLLVFGGWVNKTADDMTHSVQHHSYSSYERTRHENRVIMWVFVGIVVALVVGLFLLIRWLVT